ncbi:MAG: branched-chain amino acid aminotransferase [Actinomycetaceae bacterium]|nr:branched-chain amino acid aminotransferase [Actinomycetaceae bacterium]
MTTLKDTQLSALEQAALAALPAADELAGRFPVVGNIPLADEAHYAQVMESLRFGTFFGDHMARAVWKEGEGWDNYELTGYAPLSMDPSSAVFHYGQAVFEGLKAYRHADGSVWTFRPQFNAARFNASARRMAMPELPVEDFIGSIVDMVRADKRWVPSGEGTSLYIRPFAIATERSLGAHPAHEITYMCIGSPSGPYFTNGFAPVSIWVTRDYHRAGPGGTGEAKCSGNYAASYMPQKLAAERGHEQVFYVDVSGTYIEELGAMNAMAVMKDGTIRTPRLTGSILEGGTRGAIIQLMRSLGRNVVEEDIALDELIDGVQSGDVTEIFGCGTAAVVTPIGRLEGEGFDVSVPSGPVAKEIFDRLTAIQYGHAEDKFGWMYKLSD